MLHERDVRTRAAVSPRGHDPSPTRLELLEAVCFTFGVALAAGGVMADAPRLLVIAGPSIALSAGLRWLGLQRGLAGVMGRMLRQVLGPARLVTLRARAVAWLLVGLVVTAWGARELAQPEREAPLPPPAQLSGGTM
ncbi:MAG: hypothetical protein ABW321_04645 [Polyangiales bacterium]